MHFFLRHTRTLALHCWYLANNLEGEVIAGRGVRSETRNTRAKLGTCCTALSFFRKQTALQVAGDGGDVVWAR